jgi:uncharacterized protein YfaS (alpha-2-macroglobulin family)
MEKERKRLVPIVLLLVILAVAGYTWYMYNLEKFIGNCETSVLGTGTFIRGGKNSLRVIVTGHTDKKPLRNAHVQVELIHGKNGNPIKLFSGKTDDRGTVEASFALPRDIKAEKATIRVKTSSSRGRDTLESEIDIRSSYNIYLATDKPVYKPGQTIHMRMLALSSSDLMPAREPVTIEVLDPKGNKVYKSETKSSDFGIASGDFVLGDEISLGNYRVRALLDQDRAERTIEVKNYVLPKFKVALTTDRTFYEPSDTVKGTVRVNYFFGKPVANAKVWIDLSTVDVARKRLSKIEGATDASGTFHFL